MTARVIAGARVWTWNGRFEERTVWIRDGRIAAVGPRGDAPAPGSRDDVDVVSFPGAYVVPAFTDAHIHLLAVANRTLRCDLAPARSAAGVVAALAAYAQEHPLGDPVVGVDFDESDWQEAVLPTREDLNAVSATRPVFARRICGHVGVVNDALLRALPPSRFVDAANGRIVEDAVYQANRLSRPAADAVAAAVDTAIASLHALGIAAIHDIVDADALDAYEAGLRASARPLHIRAYFHVAARAFEPLRRRLDAIAPGRVRAAGIKIFADGSLGGRTAALLEPYADADTTGELLVAPDALVGELAACRALGIGCAVHAIGDRAMRTVVGAMETCGVDGSAFRIEHAEIIGDDDIETCARLGIPLVMQPNFVRNWGGEDGMYERRLGRVRWRRHNAFASLLRAGVPFVFSSDGMPPGPLFGLPGATRHPVGDQRIGAAEALHRYTSAAAGLPGGNGSEVAVAAGSSADLVVLSGNPVLADCDGIRVLATFVEGADAYRAAPAAHPRSRSKRRP